MREEACPLCGALGPFETVVDVRKRRHRVCKRCWLIFVEDRFLPSPEEERARYAKHQNRPFDAGYVAFLRQVVEPALPHLNSQMRGLDYGCGHHPTLCLLLEDVGLICENYDVYFFPHLPEGPFDFMFASEVVEHFHFPAVDWARMAALIRTGGILTVMTAPWTTVEEFATWGYASDGTHVAFYRQETVDWICGAFGFEKVEIRPPRVSVLKKV